MLCFASCSRISLPTNLAGDRYFASFFMLAALIQQDVDGLFRCTSVASSTFAVVNDWALKTMSSPGPAGAV